MEGQWDGVSSIIPQFSIQKVKENKVNYCIKRQKYLELIQEGNYQEALGCLRNEVTPLHDDDSSKLHALAGHLLCESEEELFEAAKWEGSSSEARCSLLGSIQKLVPPEIMLPPNRLNVLLSQAISHQISTCKFHTGFQTSQSLLVDHCCDSSPLPATPHQLLSDFSDEVWDLVFSNAGNTLAVLSKDNQLSIWNCEQTSLVQRLQIDSAHEGLMCASWSQDDSKLITGGNDGQVKFWNAYSGECIKVIKDHKSTVTSCVFVDSERFLTGGVDKQLILYDSQGKVKSWEIRVRQICKSQINHIAVLNAARNEVLVLDLWTLQEKFSIEEEDTCSAIAMSKNGKELVTNISFSAPHLNLWNLDTHTITKTFRGYKQERFILKPAFIGVNDDMLACGSEDGCIYIWNKLHGTTLAVLHGHQSAVNSIAYSGCKSQCLISASDDKTVRVWNLVDK